MSWLEQAAAGSLCCQRPQPPPCQGLYHRTFQVCEAPRGRGVMEVPMAASSLGGTCRGPAHLGWKLGPVTHCPVAQHNWRRRGQRARGLGSPSWPGCRAHRVATRKGRPPEARDRPTAADHQRGGCGGHPNFLLAGPEPQVPQPCGHHSLPTGCRLWLLGWHL